MNSRLLLGVVALLVIVGGAITLTRQSPSRELAAAGGAFDTYGYNRTARIFNGTGSSWCTEGGQASDCLDIYSPDKLVMKWTADWDRGNDEDWGVPPYPDAWIDNEWNGKGVKDGSGSVWHYKIVWVGTELEASPYWRPGGYAIWGQFEVLMDQGVDPNLGPGHIWFTKALPNGYGTGN
ncbi:MAG: hypothetical protein A2665_01200 [Candidatus Zambryskibacteria bacterium RIFCSPHIGHO2_01_FULL_46_30]|uniref:Uncharacterized protein n=1 Tax=Candidatus Zambryskibacteria bacterium RIFCSPHIGHO2_01_FULL_46_30 TaxID=1802739 RepID=A0A1G2SZ98_9BACT|nr:MAG: hypothetical protein A2665_01200 [Candidatus Zambryskibacteria bacterium RIFCSPHIGHO2_01_FULL_46_30]OHB05605.1 MAG: hypothetical protein A3B22_02435 [Candidatus Zambryskibacteria bacterium RIFCSPLOWO2_01_FULL_47_33]